MFPTTHIFTFATNAPPWDVWSTLTDAMTTARYFDGISLEASEWKRGCTISVELGGEVVGTGEVLAADGWDRLAYALDGGNGPDTYLTWIVRNIPVGSIVSLYVDEMDGDRDEEAEATWMPMVRRLQNVLAEGRTAPADRTAVD
jgi:uncharacterized protein YndB with AHSA1/START domain